MNMYLTKDAALNLSQEYTRTLIDRRYVQGKANPCLFYHPTTKVAVRVHGDDFVTVRKKEDIKQQGNL